MMPRGIKANIAIENTMLYTSCVEVGVVFSTNENKIAKTSTKSEYVNNKR